MPRSRSSPATSPGSSAGSPSVFLSRLCPGDRRPFPEAGLRSPRDALPSHHRAVRELLWLSELGAQFTQKRISNKERNKASDVHLFHYGTLIGTTAQNMEKVKRGIGGLKRLPKGTSRRNY